MPRFGYEEHPNQIEKLARGWKRSASIVGRGSNLKNIAQTGCEWLLYPVGDSAFCSLSLVRLATSGLCVRGIRDRVRSDVGS
jgi:hypothetical protein